MKRILIVALICINAALVVALVFGATSQRAYGQVIGSSYLVISGHISSDTDAVWILNLADRRLSGVKWDKNRKRLAGIGPQGGRDLRRDFNRKDAR